MILTQGFEYDGGVGPGNRFAFNYDYCKGCGVCVAECPCGAIEMSLRVSELQQRHARENADQH